jgi:hypothetical protein
LGNALGKVFSFGTGHTGGTVGSKRVGQGNSVRQLSPAVFNNAPRYHSGGVVGLKPGEVPIIAKQGEEINNEQSPLHSSNQSAFGSKSESEQRVTIANYFDPETFMAASLNGRQGEKLFMNFVKSNSGAVRRMLGVK